MTYEEALPKVDGGNNEACFGYSLTLLENLISSVALYVLASEGSAVTEVSGSEVIIHYLSGDFYKDDAKKNVFRPSNAPAEATLLKYVRLAMPYSAILQALSYGIEVAFGIFMENSFVLFQDE